MERDYADAGELQYLLDLHEEILEVSGGFWITIRAWQIEPSANVPHGLKYSFTLHSPGGRRLIGYDNAHLPAEIAARTKAARMLQPFDHIHEEGRTIKAYKFAGPGQLMRDFWESVEAKLKQEGVE